MGTAVGVDGSALGTDEGTPDGITVGSPEGAILREGADVGILVSPG